MIKAPFLLKGSVDYDSGRELSGPPWWLFHYTIGYRGWDYYITDDEYSIEKVLVRYENDKDPIRKTSVGIGTRS